MSRLCRESAALGYRRYSRSSQTQRGEQICCGITIANDTKRPGMSKVKEHGQVKYTGTQ